MQRIRRLGQWYQLGAGAFNNLESITYLLDVVFSDYANDAGPLASPFAGRTGSLTLLQNDGQFSINSGKLVVPAQGTPAWGDLGYYETSTRDYATPGFACLWKVNFSSVQQIEWGFSKVAGTFTGYTASSAFHDSASGLQLIDNQSTPFIVAPVLSTATDYYFLFVKRNAGAVFFIKGGIYTNWSVLWVTTADVDSTQLRLAMANINAVLTEAIIRLADLYANATYPVPTLGTRDLDLSTPGTGTGTSKIATPAATNTFVHTADTVIQYTLTTRPTAGNLIVYFRRVDSDNQWEIRITSAGDFLLLEEVANLPTLRASAYGVLTSGMVITIVAVNETIRGYYNSTLAWTYSSAVNFKTEDSGYVLTLGTGGVISNLEARTLDGIANGTYPWGGVELLTNTDFSAWTGDNPDGWTLTVAEDANNYVTESVNGARIVTDSTKAMGVRQTPLTIGKTYQYTAVVVNYVSGALQIYNGGSALQNIITANGTYTGYFTATATDITFQARITSTTDATWASVSVVEANPDVSTNHPGRGLATSVLSGPRAANNWFKHEADCVWEFTLGALTTTTDTILSFRYQNSTNLLFVYFKPAGQMKLGKTIAGSFSEIASTGVGAITGGERIVIVAEGSAIKGYYNTTLAWSATIAELTTQTNGRVESLGTGRVSNLIAWPRNLASAPNTPEAANVKAAFDLMATP